jgi:hypothetical protein
VHPGNGCEQLVNIAIPDCECKEYPTVIRELLNNTGQYLVSFRLPFKAPPPLANRAVTNSTEPRGIKPQFVNNNPEVERAATEV